MADLAHKIILGSRGSALALEQTELVTRWLMDRFPDLLFSVQTVQTVGDIDQSRPVSELGDKGIFVRSIERALQAQEIDVAVHSLKDVPSDEETPGLVLAAFCPREDARDVLVSRGGQMLEGLERAAIVGTSSLRRRVLLHDARPDLLVRPIRGNVDTRLRKLEIGEYDALLLAAAGLHRLGLRHRITQYLPLELFVPDAGQGIIALQTRIGEAACSIAAAVDDSASRDTARAERAFVRALGAGCQSPVGAHATVHGDRVHIRVMAAREDGSRLVRLEEEGPRSDAADIGARAGMRALHSL